ncbi:hypothetical protein PO883_28425 [Massilia sp. DJPM01]|uniref:hypothetical protein n=1 Tax=Massilia sp. DJPM01 TaxID=3024404 RepID=UPI00259EBB8A|nr:hypothetical protein [Massilia sp. DJPM01]MDM5181114.1 hypothetical protein [Massilia sp. DJPM01]
MSDIQTEDLTIATLVHSDEYAKHFKQIAIIRTHAIYVVKRKYGYEMARIPLEQGATITYAVTWALIPMLFGALLVAGIIAIFVFGSVEAGTRIPVGALALGSIFGSVLIRGTKRHLITVRTGGRTYRWRSKAGAFKDKISSTARVIAFMRARNGIPAAPPGAPEPAGASAAGLST